MIQAVPSLVQSTPKAANNSPNDPTLIDALTAASGPRAELLRIGQAIEAEPSPSKALAEARAARVAWGQKHGAVLRDRYGVKEFDTLQFRGGRVSGLVGGADTLASVKPALFTDEPCDHLGYALGRPDDVSVLESLLSHGAFRSLELFGDSDSALYEHLAALPSIGSLRSFMHSHGKMSTASVLKLVSSPHWRDIEALDLSYNVPVDDSVVLALAANDRFSSLKSLDISFTKVTDKGVAAVATALYFSLESLNISWNAVKLSQTLSTLAAGPHPATLKSLALEQCPLKPAGILSLLEREYPKLTRLEVSSARLGDAGLCAIAQSTALPALRELRARANTIRGKGVDSLVKSSTLPALRILDLSNNQLGKGAGEALGKAGALDLLEELNVSSNDGLGRQGLQAILTSKGLRSLKNLNLEQTKATHEDIEAWAAGQALPSLETLSLRYCPVGDAGAIAIAGAPGASLLRWLSLHGSGLTDAGVLALARSSRLTRLEHLDLSDTQAAASSFSALKELPALRSAWVWGGSDDEYAALERAARFLVLNIHRDLRY